FRRLLADLGGFVAALLLESRLDPVFERIGRLACRVCRREAAEPGGCRYEDLLLQAAVLIAAGQLVLRVFDRFLHLRLAFSPVVPPSWTAHEAFPRAVRQNSRRQ